MHLHDAYLVTRIPRHSYVFVNGLVGLLNCPGCDLSLYRKDIKKLKGLEADILLPGHRMVVMDRAQEHIDKAIYHMSRAFIPPSV